MPIKGVIGVNGVSAAVEFARRGVGIMAAPWVAVKADVERGHLVPVLPNFAPPPYGLYLHVSRAPVLALEGSAVCGFGGGSVACDR